MFSLLATALFLASPAVHGALAAPTIQEAQTKAPVGAETVDALIQKVYATVSFPAGSHPDWDVLRSLMLEDAVIVQPKPGGKGVRPMTVGGFIDDFKQFASSPRVVGKGFSERIVSTQTRSFGDAAHSFVVYEAKIDNGPDSPVQRGLDSFQLVRHEGRWLIASIATQVERPGRPIPEEFLKPGAR